MISISGVIFIILLGLMFAAVVLFFLFDISLHYIYMDIFKTFKKYIDKEKYDDEEDIKVKDEER